VSDNWKKIIDQDVLEKIEFIENNLENNLDSKDIVDYFIKIIIYHDEKVNFFKMKDSVNLTEYDIEIARENIFQLRKWIFEVNKKVKINPDSTNIILGINSDNPETIADELGFY
jgi:hypothetical protein